MIYDPLAWDGRLSCKTIPKQKLGKFWYFFFFFSIHIVFFSYNLKSAGLMPNISLKTYSPLYPLSFSSYIRGLAYPCYRLFNISREYGQVESVSIYPHNNSVKICLHIQDSNPGSLDPKLDAFTKHGQKLKLMKILIIDANYLVQNAT